MFNDMSESISRRMETLQRRDARDRTDGTPRLERLRQIPPETGRFLAIVAASAPTGAIVEIGTSAGYSALWMSLACEKTGRTLTTFEILPDKIELARETFRMAKVEHLVELVEGDALDHLHDMTDIAFCFLDAEKEIYAECYEAVVPNLVEGGLLVADNVVSHREILQPVVDRALADERLDAVVVPIGQGLLVGRRT